jgi:predicted enzyme related to lactoylglutathione lyase
MLSPSFFLFFVDNPEKSAVFYSKLLEKPPVEQSPTFALFALESGIMLGFWSKHTAEPPVSTTGGGGEIAFPVKEKSLVDSTYEAWLKRGYQIIQTPTQMDFGYTFTATDPDGHRLRVFFPMD